MSTAFDRAQYAYDHQTPKEPVWQPMYDIIGMSLDDLDNAGDSLLERYRSLHKCAAACDWTWDREEITGRLRRQIESLQETLSEMECDAG